MSAEDFNSDPHDSLMGKLDRAESETPRFGPIYLDRDTLTVHLDKSKNIIHLTSMEYQILWLLIRAQGRPISIGEIESFIRDLDDEDDGPLSNVVDVLISRLRKKLFSLTFRVTIPSAGMGSYSYRVALLGKE